jgi:hypothetical protein
VIDFPNSVTSRITQNGQTAVEFGTTGTAATETNWMRFLGDTSFAKQICDGSGTNVACLIQAKGTGGVIFANSSGNLMSFNNSSANTAAASIAFRAGSTSQPILIQPSSNNIAIGGTGGLMTALATDATAGFVGIPTTAGAPTGTPAQAASGAAYLVYDTTNEKLCRYFNGAWKCTAAFN